MNTKKHKHKNRPKINPANAETVKSEDLVQEKSEIDTQVPVSEVIDVPLPVIEDIAEENKEVKTESEDKEAESEPTKPKRNKNKKKKQGNEKSSPEIKEEDKVLESVKTEDNVVAESPKIDTEVKEVSENEPATASVTPSARKKKNKKKNQEKGADTKVSEDVEITQKESEAIVPVAPQQAEPEVKELPTSPEPTKQDAKKKKNKKKKRNDSERSDKSESCTSAFQKLLTDEDLPEIPAGGDNPSGKDTMTVESIVENILDDIKSPIMDIIEQTPVSPAPEEKETQKDENKSKKKNKKDKKHAQKDQELLSPENVELPVATKEEPLEIIQEPEIKDEASTKPKAKIAKPVEKKRKDKHLSQSTDNVAKESEEIKKEEIITPAEIPKETSNIKPIEEVKLITDIVEPIILNEPVEVKNTETTPVPEKTSKKGKKSPKIPVVESIEPINVVAVEVIQKPEEIIEKPIESNLPKCESKDSTKTEEKVVITPEIKESLPVEQKPEQTEIKATEDNIKFEEKTGKGKKKKKSPKTPTQVEPLIDVSTPEQSIDESKKQGESKKEVTQEAKTDIKTDTSKDNTVTTEEKDLPSIDIEVRSLRADESEGSSYDITPDVHFQRSSSQQLLDDNNNSTVIQEVCDFEDFKFTDPVPKPLIEGSGITPLGTPELISSGIKIEEKKLAEKETVKSKMMEVNKDMEELRLSIERSLAEFTAMEKKEQEEQKIEDTKTPQEKIVETPTEQKQEIFEPEPVKPQETVNIVQEELKCSTQETNIQPCSPRKDKKGKQKKKGKESTQTTSTSGTSQASTTTSTQEQEKKTDSKESQEKGDTTKQTDEKKGKQQSDSVLEPDNTKFDETGIEKPTQGDASLKSDTTFSDSLEQLDYEPIDSFEDALTSSMDDVNKTFEMIAQDAESENKKIQQELSANKPEINITKADDTGTDKDEKVNPVSQPKNLLGHKDIPVPSNRTDYKKEKNKTPNEIHAKVKIKDSEDVEKKISKESQTDNKKVIKKEKFNDSFSQIVRDNEEYVYKYSFRKVFLQSACQICKKSLTQFRVPCGFCNLVFYCSPKHKDEDYSEHQALCFAVSTIVHLKDQKHIYADAKNVCGQDYRILRMQIIVSCEKVLKRRLVPWEQEALLYPRVCADVACREWRQGKLKDCEGCGQLSYCANYPDHLPKTHHKWCKSYSLYAKLVCYQQTKGRLEPKLPTKVMMKFEVPSKINEVLASMYEEKIDMNDLQYAALTQIATAPLTAVYCHQLYSTKKTTTHTLNGNSKTTFTIHVVGAELQFEADALNKWEVFFLHLRPDLQHLKVVLVTPCLNPGNLPLDLLGKIRTCENCKNNNRRLTFSFQDKTYLEYRNSEDFINPDLVCAFNPSIQRSSAYNIKDPWPSTINSILKLKQPFIITSYTIPELRKDIAKIKEFSEVDFSVISEPVLNNFASVRPDRNFITDDEMPLLFKNYCVSVICGC